MDARSRSIFLVKLQNWELDLAAPAPGSINIPYTDIVHDGYFLSKEN
jgi:3-mercaptopyruvate sulfurtransferase SseA